MRRLWSYVCLLVLLGAALPAGATAPTAPAPAPHIAGAIGRPDFMGMVVRDPFYEWNTTTNQPNHAFQDRMGELLAAAGVRWVRIDFHIPAPPFADIDAVWWEIAKNDYFINTVAPRHDFKVLALLNFSLVPSDPCDFNPNPDDPERDSARFGGGINTHMEIWLSRALMIADRYGDNIHAFEILNEQNRLLGCEHPAQVTHNGETIELNAISPAVMGRLITKFYRFCRGIDLPNLPGDDKPHCPNAQIILGGLHPRGSSKPGENGTAFSDIAYLRAVYEDPTSVGGFRSQRGYTPFDGIGYHPYPEEIRLSIANVLIDERVGLMREMLNSVGDPCIPYWVTEVGYNVGFDIDGPRNPLPVQTERGQAAFLEDVYRTLSARRLPNCGDAYEVENVFWFKYEDFPPAEDVYDDRGRLIAPAQRWGVVRVPFEAAAVPGGARYRADGQPMSIRQAFWTYRALAGKPVYRAILPVVGRK